jgi:hypothetical protein
MDDFKEYCSRNLNRARIDPEKRRRWARHGSTDYLWTRERFLGALKYVLYEQGLRMEVYINSKLIKEELGIDLPPDLVGIRKWFKDTERHL